MKWLRTFSIVEIFFQRLKELVERRTRNPKVCFRYQVSIEAQFMVKIFSNLIVMKETLVSKGTTIFLASLQIKMTETILFCNNLGFNMKPGSI